MGIEFDRTILLYDRSWGQTVRGDADVPENWNLILEPHRLADAYAVVFHLPTAPDLTRLQKYPNQKWIGWSMECHAHYPHQADPEYMRQFDLTMTYEWTSDVPVSYFGPGMTADFTKRPEPKTADALIVYFESSHIDRSGRHAFVSELMNFLPIHSYGKIFRNRILAEDKGAETKMATISQYRFVLACENAIATDYVTEKFFDPLRTGSVPVYLGAPNIEEFAPGDHCYIDATKFSGPRELAEYLIHLQTNPPEYEAYFAWKQKPFREPFLGRLALLSKGAFTRLANKLEETRHIPPRGLPVRNKVLGWMRTASKQGIAD
jgi:hypothetical protein